MLDVLYPTLRALQLNTSLDLKSLLSVVKVAIDAGVQKTKALKPRAGLFVISHMMSHMRRRKRRDFNLGLKTCVIARYSDVQQFISKYYFNIIK